MLGSDISNIIDTVHIHETESAGKHMLTYPPLQHTNGDLKFHSNIKHCFQM